jgi:hypothetical protein
MVAVIRLTDRHLLNTIAGFPVDIGQNESLKTFLLSIGIVKHFFGHEWVDRHVSPGGPPGYLRQDKDDRTRAETQSFRLVDLAELLFNLQHTEGVDNCIDRMREGAVEATYAELDFGRMLYVSNIDFRFVKPAGKKGNDFDIEIKLPDGVTVCADAKCKIESTEFSAETIKNSLYDARKQFPADRPSIIFVKVPPRWLELQDVNRVLNLTAKEFFRTTGRIVSVKFFVSAVFWRDGAVTQIHSFHEISNPNNRFEPARNWDMFTEADETARPDGSGNFSDVPQRWRRLIFYPQGKRDDGQAERL